MNVFRLIECLDTMRSRKSKFSSQVQQNPLGLMAVITTLLHSFSSKLLQYYYHVVYLDLTMAGYSSFGKQRLYISTFSNL